MINHNWWTQYKKMDIGVLHQNNITATLVFCIQEIAKINLIQTLYIFLV